MKKICTAILVAVLSALFILAAPADELPEGVEIQSVEEAPAEQPLPTPAMEAAPVSEAPQTGDKGGTLLALTGLGLSLVTLEMARRLKEDS